MTQSRASANASVWCFWLEMEGSRRVVWTGVPPKREGGREERIRLRPNLGLSAQVQTLVVVV